MIPPRRTNGVSENRALLIAFGALAGVAVLDFYLRGVQLAPLCVIPLLVIAYFGGLRAGLVLAVLSAAYFCIVDYSPLYGSTLVLSGLPANGIALGIAFCSIVYVASLLQRQSRRAGLLEALLASSRQNEADLQTLAGTDRLTELTNRRGFEGALDEYIRRAGDDGKPLTLLYVDLNGFKEVNDRYGHEVGDAVLRLAAQRIAASVRKDDVVARIGGDEFAVLSTSPTARETIKRALFDPISFDGRRISLSASVGVAEFPRDGNDIHTLLRVADERMYADKKSGRAS